MCFYVWLHVIDQKTTRNSSIGIGYQGESAHAPPLSTEGCPGAAVCSGATTGCSEAAVAGCSGAAVGLAITSPGATLGAALGAKTNKR